MLWLVAILNLVAILFNKFTGKAARAPHHSCQREASKQLQLRHQSTKLALPFRNPVVGKSETVDKSETAENHKFSNFLRMATRGRKILYGCPFPDNTEQLDAKELTGSQKDWLGKMVLQKPSNSRTFEATYGISSGKEKIMIF